MGQNREQLNKLLAFIDELAKDKDNAWFVEELGKRFRGDNDINKISKIECYLGLDYQLDTCQSVIDYSFVKDDLIYNRLESDNREMMRYRFGVRSHKIDFNEFCRFAHLQAEMLINYYYIVVCNDDFALAKQRVLQYNPKAKIYDDYPKIENISYGYKLNAFVSEYWPNTKGNAGIYSVQGQKIHDVLSYVKDIRNGQSHRGKQNEDEEFVEQYEKDALKVGMPWNITRRDFDWKELKMDLIKKSLYDNCFEKNHKKYLFCLWKRRTPFDEVIDTLGMISEMIRIHLIQTSSLHI